MVAKRLASRRATAYLHKALVTETKGAPVDVGMISPGIVVTNLLTASYDIPSEEWDQAKRILNILGDTVETVAPFLAEGVLDSSGASRSVRWLTGPKVAKRFAMPKYKKRNLFAEGEAAAGAAPPDA